MSHVIPMQKVNQFLPAYKLELNGDLDPNTGLPVDHPLIADLEETARDIVLSRVSHLFIADEWFTSLEVGDDELLGTPSLIINITAMLVAGWVYDRQFSEEAADGISYGERRVREAYALLDGVLDGVYNIDAERVVDPVHSASTLVTEPKFTMDGLL